MPAASEKLTGAIRLRGHLRQSRLYGLDRLSSSIVAEEHRVPPNGSAQRPVEPEAAEGRIAEEFERRAVRIVSAGLGSPVIAPPYSASALPVRMTIAIRLIRCGPVARLKMNTLHLTSWLAAIRGDLRPGPDLQAVTLGGLAC